eukprot:Nk52_evm12s246 gene=Nk52_evmTU12s246
MLHFVLRSVKTRFVAVRSLSTSSKSSSSVAAAVGARGERVRSGAAGPLTGRGQNRLFMSIPPLCAAKKNNNNNQNSPTITAAAATAAAGYGKNKRRKSSGKWWENKKNKRKKKVKMSVRKLQEECKEVMKPIPDNIRRILDEKLLNPGLFRLEKVLYDNGHSIRMVGGVVRDLLRGMVPSDVDLATECSPEELIRLCKENRIRFIPTGLDHGTISVRMADGGEFYEVTTLRVDSNHTGRFADVSWTESWREDSLRRDLTINQMSLDFRGNLFDYHGGYEDLLNHRVRFVGNAVDRIQEDYLRIMRFFRFHARYGKYGDYVEDNIKAIVYNLGGLDAISRERKRAEMFKMLNHVNGEIEMEKMYELGVFKHVGLGEEFDKEVFVNAMQRAREFRADFEAHFLSSDNEENNQDLVAFRDSIIPMMTLSTLCTGGINQKAARLISQMTFTNLEKGYFTVLLRYGKENWQDVVARGQFTDYAYRMINVLDYSAKIAISNSFFMLGGFLGLKVAELKPLFNNPEMCFSPAKHVRLKELGETIADSVPGPLKGQSNKVLGTVAKYFTAHALLVHQGDVKDFDGQTFLVNTWKEHYEKHAEDEKILDLFKDYLCSAIEDARKPFPAAFGEDYFNSRRVSDLLRLVS